MVINKLINIIGLKGCEGVKVAKITGQEQLAIYPNQMGSSYDGINVNN